MPVDYSQPDWMDQQKQEQKADEDRQRSIKNSPAPPGKPATLRGAVTASVLAAIVFAYSYYHDPTNFWPYTGIGMNANAFFAQNARENQPAYVKIQDLGWGTRWRNSDNVYLAVDAQTSKVTWIAGSAGVRSTPYSIIPTPSPANKN
jgi:hypothetical protein